MFDGEKYLAGDHDILKRKRTIIVKAVQLKVDNFRINRIVDNQYKKMVNQRQIMLGQPISIRTDMMFR